jgi:hypothetical protein
VPVSAKPKRTGRTSSVTVAISSINERISSVATKILSFSSQHSARLERSFDLDDDSPFLFFKDLQWFDLLNGHESAWASFRAEPKQHRQNIPPSATVNKTLNALAVNLFGCKNFRIINCIINPKREKINNKIN